MEGFGLELIHRGYNRLDPPSHQTASISPHRRHSYEVGRSTWSTVRAYAIALIIIAALVVPLLINGRSKHTEAEGHGGHDPVENGKANARCMAHMPRIYCGRLWTLGSMLPGVY